MIMDYVVPTPEIQKMIENIKPWEIGAGIFKEDTPPEILEMDKIVMQFYKDAMDGVI